VVNAYGLPALVREFPRPDVPEGSVLLKVACASLNPIDYKIRDGDLKMLRYKETPFVLG
jgi:alcohol dehydrogenase